MLVGCADTKGTPDGFSALLDTGPPARDMLPDSSARDLAPPADAKKPCPPLKVLEGDYKGTFTGQLSTNYNVSGTVTFSLIRGGTEEFVTIEAGKMSGLAEGQYPFSADLQGKVQCDTLEADIKNGLVEIEGFKISFSGKMSDVWTHETYNAGFGSGVWNGQSIIGVTGSGNWQAYRQ
jgi:hypothetical protein